MDQVLTSVFCNNTAALVGSLDLLLSRSKESICARLVTNYSSNNSRSKPEMVASHRALM
jgi:hypothetical protein